MLRHLVLSTFLVITVSAVAASQDRTIQTYDGELIIPANPALRVGHLPTRDKDYIEFKGRFVVSGTYHVYRETAGNGSEGGTITFLDLDEASMNKLPHLKFKDGSTENIEQIRFDNEMDFLKAVLSADARNKIKKRQIVSVSGHVTLVVDNLSFTEDCGYLWTSAHFDSVQKNPELIASSNGAAYGC